MKNVNYKINYSKHPRKPPTQEFRKTASQDFGPSVCCKRLCSISPKLPKWIIQNIPENHPPKNFAKRLSKISDHLLEKGNDYKIQIFKTSPKNGYARIHANCFPRFRTIFCIFSPIYKSTA